MLPDLSKFPWGKIIRTIPIEPHYLLVEYRPDMAPNVLEYHIYVDGKDSSRGATSLDGALLTAIAYRNLGPSSQSLDMICRALKVPV